ncbi:hypothetical protein [Candidatus Villigracilis saccharophilus]|uniref:hypothetical protein n=1 Tax=Candidatus Villigracilis saccharophilus TaxID=3140684 RepID=UPI0031373C42|nr:hypothetical protein [Anaerolineales bacterium]
MNLIQENDLESPNLHQRKAVVLNGVEIFISDNEECANKFLDFIEQVVYLLELNLHTNGGAIELKVVIDCALNKPPYKTVFLSGLFDQETEYKILKAIQESTDMLVGCDFGKAIARITITNN